MSDADKETKLRNREIARNEAERQTVGDIRVSAWAIAAAVIIGLAAVGWVLIHNNYTLIDQFGISARRRPGPPLPLGEVDLRSKSGEGLRPNDRP
jgi:hypothetical protein